MPSSVRVGMWSTLARAVEEVLSPVSLRYGTFAELGLLQSQVDFSSLSTCFPAIAGRWCPEGR